MTLIERSNRKPCVLITGFGRFPGAAFNPSEQLARALSRVKRPALSNIRVVGHVFPTSYAAVDRDFPALLEKHNPDILLMFGVAPNSKAVRIEVRARNALSRFPDATRFSPKSRTITPGTRNHQAARAPLLRMLHAARRVQRSSALSRNAGRYLCNYVYWRALEAAGHSGGPKLVAFVHVPPVRRPGIRRSSENSVALTSQHLRAIGEAILVAMSSGLRTRAPD